MMNKFVNRTNLFQKHIWANWAFPIFYLVLLVFMVIEPGIDTLCQQMGVDYRGYYASGEIVRNHGFGAVYDQALQKKYQEDLLYSCPTLADGKPLFVAMPYLPIFVILFIPFTYLPFTTSFFLWTALHFGLFFFALYNFSKILVGKTNSYRIFQWGVGLPFITNLYLGQINALLVFLLCRCMIFFWQGKHRISGGWLSILLLKPHILILILPGLIISQNWSMILGFSLGTVFILGSSFLLAGWDGLTAMGKLTYQFAGPLIQNPAGMMNWRALGLNLAKVIPNWLGWVLAAALAAIITWVVLHQWWKSQFIARNLRIGLVPITLIGTFIVSWHSHFYMQMLLVPFLLILDTKRKLPQKYRLAWLLGPPLFFITVHFSLPALQNRIFGLFMLSLNIFMFWGLTQIGFGRYQING